MGTPYSDVFDYFLTHVKDWKLTELYKISPNDFETYLLGFMVTSIPLFTNCRQSLARNDETKEFVETLTEQNVDVLSSIMVEKWLEKEVQDVRQMSLNINDRDFKHYSEAQNLKEKSDQWGKIREKNSQMLVDYGFQDTTYWTNMLSGNYYTP